jgi:hypothetical protein
MAITVSQQPATNTPAFNNQWFDALSNQLAQPNFRYYVKITISNQAGSTTYDVPVNTPPDTYLKFNAKSFVRSFCKSYIPLGLYGWKTVTDGLIKVVVNIGEEYGATPTYYAGSNITYYVWNGREDFLDWPSYSAGNYVSDLTTIRYLNDLPYKRDNEVYVTSSNSLYLYFLADATATFKKIVVDSYTGGPIYVLTLTKEINNPFHNSATWYERYLCIDVSKDGLLNCPLAQVTGGVVPIDPNASKYVLSFIDDENDVSSTLTVYVDSICTKDQVFWLHYLNDAGAYDCFPFSVAHEKNHEYQKTYVDHIPYSGTSTYTYASTKGVTNTLSVQKGKTLKLKSDWINETQSTQLEQLLSSPSVYIQYAIGQTYSVRITDTKYFEKTYQNEKLFNLELTVEFNHKNYRQDVI